MLNFHTQPCRMPKSLQDLEILDHSYFDNMRPKRRTAGLKLLHSLHFTNFANLQSLTIYVNMVGNEIPITLLIGVVGTVRNFRLTGCDEGINTDYEFEKNLNIIGGLGWRLKSINVLDDHEFSPLPKCAVKAFRAMLASSATTVETIKLDEVGAVDQLHEVLCQAFPCLKNIKLTISPVPADATAIAGFFNLQPKLESIQFGFTGGQELFGNYPIFLDAVKSNFSSRLHTLCLHGTTPLFQYFAGTSYIRQLQGLKVFGIRNGSLSDASSRTWIAAILNNLPSTIRCIVISTQPNFRRAAETIMPGLAEVPFLSELKLRNNVIDEDGLQFICKAFTGLRVLQFGADDIHDFGFTGEGGKRRPDSGVSLRNLRGLRKLDIIKCCKATPKGLVKAVQFLELKNLKRHISVKHISQRTRSSKSHLIILAWSLCLADILYGSHFIQMCLRLNV